MNELAHLNELAPSHDSRALTTPQEGIKYVRAFEKAVAAAKAIGADRTVVNNYAEQLVRHVRETGRLIEKLPRLTPSEAGSRKGKKASDTDVASFSNQSGIDRRTAERWQALSTRITDEVFEEKLVEIREDDEAIITLSEFYALFKEAKNQERAAEIERQVIDLAEATPSAPLGLFHVIAIDPPWPYDDGVSQAAYDAEGHRASNPYPEMSLEQIAAMPIPAAEDCVLWLWTTHKFMRHAFPLLDGWGFQDRAIVTWCKDRMGLGRWLRSQSEFCIMATRGKPLLNLTNQTTLVEGPMREHSRKPDEFYTMVDSLCAGRKLDFFSREPRDGWEQFGNDTERFALGQ